MQELPNSGSIEGFMILNSDPVNVNFRAFRRLLLAASILVYSVIVMGGVVRATGLGGACGEWPLCGGALFPPMNLDSIIAYLHRLDTFLLVLVLAGATILSSRHFRNEPWLRIPLWAAGGLVTVQIIIGGIIVIRGLPVELTSVHLGLSLLIQALVLIPAVIAVYYERAANNWEHKGGDPVPFRPEVRLRYQSPFARLSLWTLGAVFLLLVSGAIVSGSASGLVCSSWPLCDGNLLPATGAGWINVMHRTIVALTGILVAVQTAQAWRTQRSQIPVLVATTAAGVLFFAQALMGAYKVFNGFPIFMVSLHEASAVAVWSALVVQVVAVGMSARTAQAERLEAASAVGRPGMLKDFLMLTKPIVVLLLLVTTFAGMVIGAQEWPSFSLVFWTILGGAMAAGGSGAINQYLDREEDSKMQRTERRPIPSGRLTPGEGLAFGVAICLASFYIMVAFVNLLAALLTLAGMIYYILIYSIFLKKATVQNIVIGGGAGAIPPLVGWAAATGSLNIPSLFLFAVVFMWTPPHFWALALVKRKDYARAGIPMLPVIRGEKETRWQILIYTIELVALTLILPFFGLGSGVYLVSAFFLGAALLYSAWKVWRKGGNKLAWKMYRYSSMYLAFLFLALMVDALV
jgi:heme o synthase